MAVAIACVTRLQLNAAMVGVGRERGRLDDAAWKQSVLNSREKIIPHSRDDLTREATDMREEQPGGACSR